MLLSIANLAHAQRPTVLLQHGFLSDRDTWSLLDSWLEPVFDADFYRYSTGASQSFPAQGAELVRQWSGVPGSTVYVGHSNGGIVGRELVQAGRHWKSLVTIGSPHYGAKLATSLLDGSMDNVIAIDVQALVYPLQTYASYYPTFSTYQWTTIFDTATWAAGLLWDFNLLKLWMGYSNGDVLAQMRPGEPYLDLLNSPGSVAAEASSVLSRYEITSTLGSYNGVWWRALTGSAESTAWMVDSRDFAEGVLLGAFTYYQFFPDLSDPHWAQMQGNAWLWLQAAAMLASLDAQFCILNGSIQSDLTCGPSDGVVPLVSQHLPSANVSVTLTDVSHTEETTSGLTYQRLYAILVAEGIPLRPSSGGPLSVGDIVGPAATTSGATDAFSIAVSGSHPPFTVRWSVDNVVWQNGTNSTFEFTNAGADFFLSVRVEDATGLSITRARSISVTNCGGLLYC
ncbi:MAG: alpha/beta hydrolase [Gemmatimonadetes bacterium]|nr:alpha/beta hydrolase [Gemmatimonadota bacterium]